MISVPVDAMAGGAGAQSRRKLTMLVGVAVVLLAFNLRTAVTSLGAVLDDVRAALGLSATSAGVLTTLPVLCFAGFGAVAPVLARRFGTQRVVAASVAAITLGLVARAVTGSATLFFVVTAIALAGMATGNVLLPALVKRHYPERVGRMTGLYTTSLMIGSTVAAAATVPAGDVVGGWRGGLAVWAVTAAIALLPWLAVAHHSRTEGGGPRHVGAGVPCANQIGTGDPCANGPDPARALSRSPLAWALAVYFGSQSLQAYATFGWLPQVYRDAGFDATTSGLLLAVVTALGIPVAYLLPTLAADRPDQRPYVVACVVAFAAGYLGLMAAPAGLPWLWVVLLGIGGGSFPLALTLIGLRAHDADVTARLSGFAQGIGYVIAASGPVAVGTLYDATGGWTAPLGLLIGLLVPQLVAGWYAAGHRTIEREK
jgi:MFS transporter, CP family, cyanate transporter